MTDPIDMTVTVHQDGTARQGLQHAHEPVAVDQCRADAFRQGFRRARIFYDVMMQGDDPAGPRVLLSLIHI